MDLKDPYNINFLHEMQVFIGVEPAANLAAIRHKKEDLERLNRLMEEMAEAIRNGEDEAIPHRAFHKSIAEASSRFRFVGKNRPQIGPFYYGRLSMSLIYGGLLMAQKRPKWKWFSI